MIHEPNNADALDLILVQLWTNLSHHIGGRSKTPNGPPCSVTYAKAHHDGHEQHAADACRRPRTPSAPHTRILSFARIPSKNDDAYDSYSLTNCLDG